MMLKPCSASNEETDVTVVQEQPKNVKVEEQDEFSDLVNWAKGSITSSVTEEGIGESYFLQERTR